MQFGDTVEFYTKPEARPRVAKVVKKWSESLANLVVFLDGTNDADDFGNREITSCTAWRTSVPFVPAGGEPPTGQHFRELSNVASAASAS